MSNDLRGTYVGPVLAWRGETAILLEHPAGVLAQFDNLENELLTRDGFMLQYCWHLFPIADWQIEERQRKSD